MNFLHDYKHEPFPELEVHNIGGMRFYEAPNGLKYPSITTVLGKRPGKQEGLQKWRDRIGEEQARIVSGKAARRGTAFHYMCEDYLNNKDITEHKDKHFLAYCMFGELRQHLDSHIGLVSLQEQSMYSDTYKVAGRCDLIGVYDNKVSVIDFKTTTTPKKEEWIEDYFIQCAAYCNMYEEHTGEEVEQIVIMMVCEDGRVDIYKKKPKDYLSMLDEMMDEFYTNIDGEFDK